MCSEVLVHMDWTLADGIFMEFKSRKAPGNVTWSRRETPQVTSQMLWVRCPSLSVK
jgi:hypothetical protein